MATEGHGPIVQQGTARRHAHRLTWPACLPPCLHACGLVDCLPSLLPWRRWVPIKERSRSLSLVYSGMYSGSVLGLALSPQMIASYGWSSVFYVFGLAGVVWFLLWQRHAASSPQADPGISDAEARYIERNTACRQQRVESIPWRLLLSKAPVWALIISHFCHNWGTFILLTYMPTYYTQVRGAEGVCWGLGTGQRPERGGRRQPGAAGPARSGRGCTRWHA